MVAVFSCAHQDSRSGDRRNRTDKLAGMTRMHEISTESDKVASEVSVNRMASGFSIGHVAA